MKEAFFSEIKKYDYKCDLCYAPNFQAACIIKTLIEMLKNVKQNFVFSSAMNQLQKKEYERENKNSCYRLILMLFDAQYNHSSSYRHCQHKEIQKILYTHANCQNFSYFLKLCQHLAFFIGQRNFQLQTLTMQIKNLPLLIHQTIQQDRSQNHEKYNLEQHQIQINQMVYQNSDEILVEVNPQEPSVKNEVEHPQNQIKENYDLNRNLEYIFPNIFPFYYFHQNH